MSSRLVRRCVLAWLTVAVALSCAPKAARTLRGADRDDKLRTHLASVEAKCAMDSLSLCSAARLCRDDQVKACLEAGETYAYGLPYVRDRDRGRRVYEQLCLLDVSRDACAQVEYLDEEPRFPDAGFGSWPEGEQYVRDGGTKTARRTDAGDASDSGYAPATDEAPDGGLPVADDAADAGSGPRQSTDAGVVMGSLNKDEIRAVIFWHVPEVRWCFETERRDEPKAAGKVSIKFVILGDGRIHSAQVARSNLSAEVSHCVADQVKTWRFPRPRGGGVVIVTYPFVLPPN